MWWYRALHARAVELLAGACPSEGHILDAGCGTGGLLQRLAGAFPGARLAGADINGGACAVARAKSGASVAAASVAALPFASETFDAVVSNDVLCHAAVDEAAALAEMRRVLRPGGSLVVNLPAYQWLHSAHDTQVHNARRYTRAGVVRLLEGAGFETVRAHYWNGALFPLLVLRRKVFSRAGASDVGDVAPVLNGALFAVTEAERRLARAGLRLPFGSSIVAVARRPRRTAGPDAAGTDA